MRLRILLALLVVGIPLSVVAGIVVIPQVEVDPEAQVVVSGTESPVTARIEHRQTADARLAEYYVIADCGNSTTVTGSHTTSPDFNLDGCSYPLPGTYCPIAYVYSDKYGFPVQLAQKNYPCFEITSANTPVILLAEFSQAYYVQPGTAATFRGNSTGGDTSITWKGDFSGTRCSLTETNPLHACFETTIATTAPNAFFLAAALPDVFTESGNQTYRIVAYDADEDAAFANVSVRIDKNSLSGWINNVLPAGGCTKTVDCSAIDVVVRFMRDCTGPVELWIDDDSTPGDGTHIADATSNPYTFDNIFNFEGALTGDQPISVRFACGDADPVDQVTTYPVRDAPEAPTFSILAEAPQFLNNNLIVPATLVDWCVTFESNRPPPTTNIDVNLGDSDSTTDVLLNKQQATNCFEEDPDGGPDIPVTCPERWCLSEGGFTGWTYNDSGIIDLNLTGDRGSPVMSRSASARVTLTDPVLIGDLTTNIGDPIAVLSFRAPDNTDPAIQCFNVLSKNANPVHWSIEQEAPPVAWIAQLTTNNGTCSGTTCSGTTPAQICVQVRDTADTVNLPPTGVNVPNYAVQLPTNSQLLSCGDNVVDPEDDDLTFAWTGSGTACPTPTFTPSATVEAPTITGLVQGQCIVACGVEDSGSGSAVSDSGTITVSPEDPGGATDFTLLSTCRGYWDFSVANGLNDTCLDGGNNDALTLSGNAELKNDTPPTGVNPATWRWLGCFSTGYATTTGVGAGKRFLQDEFTLFAVIRMGTSVPSQYMFGSWNGVSGGYRFNTLSTSLFRTYLHNGAFTGSIGPTASTVHTIGVSHGRLGAGKGYRFYRDGVADPKFTDPDGGYAQPSLGTGEFTLCGYGGNHGFNDGYIGSVLYLGGPGSYLSAGEHQTLCRYGPKGPNPGGWQDRASQCGM